MPFGTAQVVSGNKYSYYISPPLFYKFIGKPLPLKYQEKTAKELGVIIDPAIARTMTWESLRR